MSEELLKAEIKRLKMIIKDLEEKVEYFKKYSM